MRRHAKAATQGSTKRQAKGLLIAALALGIVIAIAAQAFAAKGVVKSIGGSTSGVTGGLFAVPRGMAVNTSGNGAPAGTLYVVDSENNRIQRFDASGNFLSAFGKDVGGAGVNVCTVPASCAKGTAAASAGAFGASGARGIAVEGATGNVYVTDQVNRRVDVFSATGTFEGAFGWKVNATTPEEKLQLCTTATGCQVGSTGSNAGQFGAAIGYPAIAPAGAPNEGHVFIANKTSRRVDEFEPTLTAGEVTAVAFTRGYGWGASNGTAEFQTCTATCVAPAASGNAQGQFAANAPSELGVDASGNVYALDPGNNRVQKFNPSATPTDSSFASTQLNATPAPADLYVNPAASGHVLVNKSNGTEIRTLELSSAGALLETHGSGAGITSANGLALDPGNGNIYLASGNRVFVLNTPLVPPAVTIDPVTTFGAHSATFTGTVNPNGFETSYQFEYSADGSNWTKLPASPASAGSGGSPVAVSKEATGLGANTTYEVKLVATKPFGAGSATSAPQSFTTSATGPSVEAAFATEVGRDQAKLDALIDPNGSATTYQFQYVDDAHYKPLEANPYAEGSSVPASPQAIGSGTTPAEASQQIEGLSPDTTYHYRVVAANGSGSAASPDRTIATWPAETGLEADCPNQAFRVGPSAALPDCRAYEMVSPVDKNGGDISFTVGPNQVSPDGDRLAYATKPTFGDQPSSKAFNQYLATRHEGEGWTTNGINAPLGRLAENEGGGATPVAREATAFSADLCSEWLADQSFFPLAAGAQQGYRNLYRQDLCGDGGFETLTTTTPPAGANIEEYVNQKSVQGFSADGSEAFFVARTALTPEAAPGGVTLFQIYVHSPSGLHLVSVLPGGVPVSVGAEVGGGSSGEFGGYLDNAVSEDGSRVFWTSHDESGVGKVYLREHPEQGIVAGECSEAAKACTIPVSAGDQAFFWTAAADGSAALYSEGALGTGEENQGNATLYRFDVAGETSTPVAQGVTGVLGASDDLSRVYFLSREALTPGQTNGEGDEAVAGQPNLYLDEGGTKTYIATLLAGKSGDLKGSNTGGGEVYGIGNMNPIYNTSRVSPDGAHIAFQSRAPLTGYDNTDAKNGKADLEVFAYEAGGALKCVSCNPSGARPNGGEAPRAYVTIGGGPDKVWFAARIPGWEEARLHVSNVLSPDGSRLFFMAYDALVPADTNGAQDVYEWEAPGSGRCSPASPAYHDRNGGCVYLISSGESPEESYFWEASPDGSDVFFGTASALLPQDPGLVDIYDARVDGGFPRLSAPPACEGESCQSAPPPPTEPTLSSASFRGEGNQKSAKPNSKRCTKGRKAVKKRGKTRCVPRKHHQKHRTANHNRRTAR